MDSEAGTKANLKKYIKLHGRWRFVPVAKHNGRPVPATILIKGVPTHSKQGTFYLEWWQGGRRKQEPAGSSPREALNAWSVRMGLLEDCNAEPFDSSVEEQKTLTTTACTAFLRQVKATKSAATHRAYTKDLEWFQRHIGKHYVSAVTRGDIVRIMGIGRDEALNQKTINERLIVGLMALRNAGAEIKMKKGDWPRTTDSDVEIYTQEVT